MPVILAVRGWQISEIYPFSNTVVIRSILRHFWLDSFLSSYLKLDFGIMAPMVCRLRYRIGEPLSLTIYPGPTFMSLPREIRNKIYRLLLVASEPIVVYSTPVDPPAMEQLHTPRTYLKVAHLTFGLLRVNKMISTEASAIFYRYNVFKFRGSQNYYEADSWDILYSFLFTVGERNRACLQYLEADISRPMAVAKDANGTISSLFDGSFWMRKVYARDQYARIYPPVRNQYLGESVDYISPAIEAVFRILGTKGSRLQLLLIMEFADFPEISIYESNGLSGWSKEVPDYVEQMRKRFTSLSSGDGAKVEVLWKGTYFKSEFLPQIKRIENNGWEVIEIQDSTRYLSANTVGRGVVICVIFRRNAVRNI